MLFNFAQHSYVSHDIPISGPIQGNLMLFSLESVRSNNNARGQLIIFMLIFFFALALISFVCEIKQFVLFCIVDFRSQRQLNDWAYVEGRSKMRKIHKSLWVNANNKKKKQQQSFERAEVLKQPKSNQFFCHRISITLDFRIK